MESSQDRNLPASEQKLKKARDDGQVTRSRDLSHLAVLGIGALSLLLLAPAMFERLKVQLRVQLSFDASVIANPASMLERLQSSITTANTRLLFQLEFLGFSRISLGANPLAILKENVPRYQYLREQTSTPSRFSNYD